MSGAVMLGVFLLISFSSVAIGIHVNRDKPRFGEVREQGWWDVEHTQPRVFMYTKHIGSPFGWWQLMPPPLYTCPPIKISELPESLRG